MRIRLIFLAFAALAATALVTAACGGGDDKGTATATKAAATGTGTAAAVSPQAVTITAHDFGFDKTTITAKAGQVINITLKNAGSAEHSFTVGDTDAAEAKGGEEKTGSFTASSSTTEFHCKYHPSTMKGTITIDSSSSNLSPSSSAAAAIGGYSY